MPNDFISNLWPVGDGYAGFYEIKELSLDDYLILSAYESDGHNEIIWDGTFSGPGTNKNLVAYVAKIPEITGLDLGWISGNKIETGTSYLSGTPDSLEDGVFITDNGIINMPTNKTAKFTASSIYFQHREANLDLDINIAKRSTLNLHSRSVIFNGKVDFKDDGKIVLETSNEDGSYISEIDGGLIGEDPMQNYGIVYIAEPMTLNNASTVVNSGMYYFKNGIILPGEGEQLIPITKENYIHD